MKKIGFWVLFLSFNTFASPGNETTLHTLGDEKKVSWRRLASKPVNSSSKKHLVKRKRRVRRGNLPQFLVRNGSYSGQKATETIAYPTLKRAKTSGLKIGEVIPCILRQDLKAYVGSVSPVRVEILEGPNKGGYFVGNATMDPKTKDIVVEFSHLQFSNGKSYALKATLHSSSGVLGLKGTFRSRYWQHFFATVLGRAAEGYARATVDQQSGFFGFQPKPNLENAGKVAAAEGAAATAGEVQQKMKSLPEYVTKKGSTLIKVFILNEPTEIN